MFLDKDSFFIDNINIGQYLTQVEFGHNKMWADDTGRNLKGKTTGTFLGIVWKFKLSFGPLTQAELELLSPHLDAPWQSTTYYDTNKKQNETIETYTGDWATLNRTTFTNVARANEPFDISVIATTPIK